MNDLKKSFSGKLTVIAGCMYAGKTELLISKAKQIINNGGKVQAFKPKIDTRYDIKNIVSHQRLVLQAIALEEITDIDLYIKDNETVLFIDEIQMWKPNSVEFINSLANRGYEIIVAGLDKDFLGKPFENTAFLMAFAEEVIKLSSICAISGKPAYFTHKLSSSKERFEIGGNNLYEPLSRNNFYEKM